jgi:hypothetical protein
MKLRTRSILEELNDIAKIRNVDNLYESRAVNIINSAINLVESLKTHYDLEESDELERRLINAIRGQDPTKFTRGIRKIAESKRIKSKLNILSEDAAEK